MALHTGNGPGPTTLGNSATAVEERRRRFVDSYLSNGRVAYRAAIVAGYSPRSATSAAGKLLEHPDVARMLIKREKELRKIAGIDAERSYKEIARIAYLDRKDLYDEDGNLLPEHKLDDDTRAAVESYSPKDGYVMLDKLKALDMTMKHVGGFEKDNIQRREDIQVQIVLVSGKANGQRTDNTITDVPYTSIQRKDDPHTDDEPLW